MADVEFPPVELADPETGLLCVGGDLSVSTLLAAYRSGVFPWPIAEGEELYWFAPEQRGVLVFEEMKISRSLQKVRRQQRFEEKLNTDFAQIVHRCASVRSKKGERTWITPRIEEAYLRLFEKGHALSLGTYSDGKLVGGVYGVTLGSFFAGESMFFEEPNASKVALWAMTEYLQTRGVKWLDCQQLTPALAQFGARLLPRAEFMKWLKPALANDS